MREWILDTRTTGEELLSVSPGLTPEMVAGVTKLMSNMDLVVAARKIRVVVRCNNGLRAAGTMRHGYSRTIRATRSRGFWRWSSTA